MNLMDGREPEVKAYAQEGIYIAMSHYNPQV